MTKVPTWQKPVRWWAPWRAWSVRREWDRQVRCMAEAGFRRTGWASWERPAPLSPAGRERRRPIMPDTEIIWSTREMSNFDLSIDEGLEGDLRAGMRARHSAWDFNGQVWYDPDEDAFKEDVWVYHAKQATLSAPTLEDLMRVVNDQFGWA